MVRWLLRRLAVAALTALAAIIVLIILVHLLPGDPLAAKLGEGARDPATVAALQARYGLNQPIPAAVATYLAGLAHGNLGISITQDRPVRAVLAERIGPTLLLAGLTLLIDFTVGLALGVWSALHPHSVRSRLLGIATVIGYTLPSFVVGTLLVWAFAVKLAWLPPGDLASALLPLDAGTGAATLDHLRHLVLPLAAMVIATIAVPLRQQRALLANPPPSRGCSRHGRAACDAPPLPGGTAGVPH